MSTVRLLLPFTGWLDAQALDHAIELAQCEGAMLILLSLIVIRVECKGGKIRLEQIQQSKDFLIFAAHKAHRSGVAVESHEVYTHDAVRSLTLQAQEQMCDAILLFVRDKQGVLLQSDEVKRILEWRGITRCVTYLPVRVSLHAALWTRLARWWRKPSAGGTAVHVHARHADSHTHSFIPDRLSK